MSVRCEDTNTLPSLPWTTHPILLLHFTKRSLGVQWLDRGCPLRASSPGSIRLSQSSFLHCPTLPYLFCLCRKAETGRQSLCAWEYTTKVSGRKWPNSFRVPNSVRPVGKFRYGKWILACRAWTCAHFAADTWGYREMYSSACLLVSYPKSIYWSTNFTLSFNISL